MEWAKCNLYYEMPSCERIIEDDAKIYVIKELLTIQHFKKQQIWKITSWGELGFET